MFRRLVTIAATLALLLAPITARGETIPRIAIAYDIGFLGDNGYNDAIHEAMELAKREFKIAAPNIREVPTSGTTLDRLTRLRFLAKSGYTLIIAVGSGYRDTLRRVSREYPTIQFAIINDQSISPLNISNIYFVERDSAYLAGVAAALQSKSKKISIITDDESLIQSFRDGANRVRSKMSISAIDFTGDLAKLDQDLGATDIVYSLWDRDASVYKFITARAVKTRYIARIPDQYFVAAGLASAGVTVTIRKDLTKPIQELFAAALSDSAVIDVLDERGIYGREYSIRNGAITFEFKKGSLSANARTKFDREVARLKQFTNQG